MISLYKTSFTETFKAIDEFLTQPHLGKVIDKNLNVVEKKGYEWVLLYLLAPFYRFFGEDPYSHVRVHRVTDWVLKLCQENVANLNKYLIQSIKDRILKPLSKQTKGKYQAHFDAVATKLDALVYSQIPANYLNLYRLNNPENSAIQISTSQQDQVIWAISQLSPQLKADPEKYFLRFFKNGKSPYVTRQLQLWEKTSQSAWGSGSQFVRELNIPISLYIETRKGLIHDIVLLAKAIIGEGGQTKVRSCFGLLTCRFLARKKIPADQRQALEPLLKRNLFTATKNRPARGLVSVEIWREIYLREKRLSTNNLLPKIYLSESRSPTHNLGIQLFELIAGGTLVDALLHQKKLCSQISIKKHLMEDLLYGLHVLHTQEHPGFEFDPPRAHNNSFKSSLEHRSISVPPFKIAHGDLKPGNILITQTINGKLLAQITDFGSLNPAAVNYTVGFSSPEKIAYCSGKGHWIAFHESYAQAADVWSMGLICVLILSGKFSNERYSLPPLSSIHKKWFDLRPLFKNLGSNDKDMQSRAILALENKVLSQITQAEINQDLAVLAKESAPELKPLWNLVKQMLQIRSTGRITAEQALEQFQDKCLESASDPKVDS